jgi:serine/threonine-protein kinase
MDIPRDLEAITLKCLEKDRSKRYSSAKAFADDLDRFLAGEPVLARPTGFWYRVQRKLYKHKELAVMGAAALVIVAAAFGTTLKTRHDANRRERLAQQFTESMARIESMTRYSALSPLHDIRPDLQAVRAHMTQLQEDMKQAGTLANGPGHYALGRGYWTLDDDEKAREHLQMAWDTGYREPRVAYALGVVLGKQYQEKLLEAERISSSDQRDARKKEIETKLRDPALGLLRQAKGSDVPSQTYLEALMAFYEGRLDESLDRLKALQDNLPWFYEAPLLRGSLLQARAWKQWNQGHREEAHADFEAGRSALTAAAAVGRSAPSVHAAMAELEFNALAMAKTGQGSVEDAFSRGMVAAQKALSAQPDHVHTLILESAFLGQLAEFKTTRGENSEALVQQAVATAQKALEAGGTRSDAWIALGKAYYQWGNVRQDQNLDPAEQLARGIQVLESLSIEKRDYTVENHIGLIHQTWSDYEEQNGKDPSAHLNGAIAAYERATRMEPHLLPAWINLGTCLQQRAALPQAADPESDLQAALEVLEQAHTLNPKHFVPYFVQGKVYLAMALRKRDRGEDSEPDLLRSIEANRQGMAINPMIPHLHNGQGIAQLRLARAIWERGGNPFSAIASAQTAFKKTISVAPNQVLGYLNLGDLLIWKARFSHGSASMECLRQAEAALDRSLVISPNKKDSFANLGHLSAVRVQQALGGGDPTRELAQGERALAKGLALDPRDPDCLRYLGELRTAAAKWKAGHHQAQKRDFEQAEEPLRQVLQVARDHRDTLMILADLWLSRGVWERSMGQAQGASFAQSRECLNRILKLRPKWGEALALQGHLELMEAESLPEALRAEKASESARCFKEAFARNGNLLADWKARADQAQRWGRAAS